MYWDSALSTAAEVGIGIAGFSAIFAAVSRRDPERWGSNQQIAFNVLLVASGAAIFACLMPFLLLSAGLSGGTPWAITSAVYGPWLIWIVTVRLRQQRQAGISLSWVVPVSYLSGAIVTVNVFYPTAPWPYLIGVYWQLFVAFRSFLILMRGTVRAEDAGRDA